MPENTQYACKAAAISIENLSYTYPDGRQALKNISVQFKKGKKTAIIGLNGSVKSTLLYHLNGTFYLKRALLRWKTRLFLKKRSIQYGKRQGFYSIILIINYF